MQLRPHNSLSVLSIVLLLILTGCSSVPMTPVPATPTIAKAPSGAKSSHPALPAAGSGRGGYYQDDGPGDEIPDGLADMPDADPRIEPYATRGNKPYVVFGKRYTPLIDDQPFKQRGFGSWYGKKFHGQKTSSGELYDMYKMTAAHPTLPIPSYARVTNLSNGKQVIVRVNDRGPFHSSRVIDLSYTAALKLGYIGKGSAELQVERLLPTDIEQILAAKNNGQSVPLQMTNLTAPTSLAVSVPTVDATPLDPLAIKIAAIEPSTVASQEPIAVTAANAASGSFYLQFGAYSQIANAETMRSKLSQDTGGALQLTVEPSNNLYRIYGGPFTTREEAMTAAAHVQNAGVTKPFVVQR
jgi:rare lipoprotein A